jgi:hypothetical protein
MVLFRYVIEQMAAFNRERVPERQPHTKGTIASTRPIDIARWSLVGPGR